MKPSLAFTSFRMGAAIRSPSSPSVRLSKYATASTMDIAATSAMLGPSAPKRARQGCGLQSLAATSFARCGTHARLADVLSRHRFVSSWRLSGWGSRRARQCCQFPRRASELPAPWRGALEQGKMTVQSTCVGRTSASCGRTNGSCGDHFSPRLNGFGVPHRRIWDHQLLVVFEHA